MTTTLKDIELAKDRRVTCDNYQRLGYERLTMGAYGRLPPAQGRTDERGVRLARFLQHAQAVIAVSDDQVVLYGPSALQALGVALPSTLEDWVDIHVLVKSGNNRPARHGVVAHRVVTTPDVWRHVHGLPVQHPVDHWLQLRQASKQDLIEVGDGFLRRRRPLLSLEDMSTRLDGLSGCTGVKAARAAMPWVRARTESILETRTRLVLIRYGLPEPVVSCQVFCHAVGIGYEVDMGYPDEKVAVEYDGSVHSETNQRQTDALRRGHLLEEGWVVISVTAAQLRTPSELARLVEATLARRRNIPTIW